MPATRLAVTLVATATFLVACGGSSAEQRLVIAEPVSRLVVENSSGDITVNGGEDEVVIEAVIEASGEPPVVEPDVTDGTLTLADVCSGVTGCSVSYTLSMPETIDVEVTSGTSTVSISQIEGDVSVAVRTGDIFLNTVTGDLVLDLETGGVLGARLVSSTGTVSATSGDVDLTFDDPVDELVINVRTGEAKVQVPRGPYAVDAETGAGDVDVQIDTDDTAARRIAISVTTGDITIFRK